MRGSIERLPTIRLTFTGPAPSPTYALTNGRAHDCRRRPRDERSLAGLGPRQPRVHPRRASAGSRRDQRDGTRYFAEGGGGVMSGPFGVDISVKFAVNRFYDAGAAQLPT